MVMTKNDEQLIRRFMQEHKHEVADNGFSRRVMRRLPMQAQRLSDILTAIGVAGGCILFYVFDGPNWILSALQSIFQYPINNWITSLQPQTCLPILGVIVFWGIQRAYSMMEEG